MMKWLALAACALCLSSAEATLNVGYWTFPTTAGPLTPDAGSMPANVTATMTLSGTASYTHAGTTLNDPAASPVASQALQLYNSTTAPVLTIKLTGTGLSGLSSYVLTYAAESASASTTSRSITWAYSLNNTTWTTLQTDTVTTGSFKVYTDNFSGLTALNGATTIYFRGTFGATTGTGAYFDNIHITAVPEPVNCALAGFGLIFVGGSAGRFYFARRHRAGK